MRALVVLGQFGAAGSIQGPRRCIATERQLWIMQRCGKKIRTTGRYGPTGT